MCKSMAVSFLSYASVVVKSMALSFLSCASGVVFFSLLLQKFRMMSEFL